MWEPWHPHTARPPPLSGSTTYNDGPWKRGQGDPKGVAVPWSGKVDADFASPSFCGLIGCSLNIQSPDRSSICEPSGSLVVSNLYKRERRWTYNRRA